MNLSTFLIDYIHQGFAYTWLETGIDLKYFISIHRIHIDFKKDKSKVIFFSDLLWYGCVVYKGIQKGGHWLLEQQKQQEHRKQNTMYCAAIGQTNEFCLRKVSPRCIDMLVNLPRSKNTQEVVFSYKNYINKFRWKTTPVLTSDNGHKSVLVLAHSFLLS